MRRLGMWRSAMLGTVGAALLAGCGGGAAPDPLVAVEAQWLCEVSRYAYADAGGAADGLNVLLDRAGLSQDDYAGFKAAIDNDAGLRTRISDAYHDVCGGAT